MTARGPGFGVGGNPGNKRGCPDCLVHVKKRKAAFYLILLFDYYFLISLGESVSRENFGHTQGLKAAPKSREPGNS